MRWRSVALAFLSAAACGFAQAPPADPLARQVEFVAGADHFPEASADGKEILAQRGIMNDESTVSLDLRPGETYCLIAAQVGSTPNVIVPEGAPLVLSRTPEGWFMPELK